MTDPAASSFWRDFSIRLASALVLFGIAMGVVFAGGWVLAAFIALTTARMAFEWVRLTRAEPSVAIFAAAVAGIFAAAALAETNQFLWAFVAIACAALVCGALALRSGSSAGWAAALTPYLATPSVALIWLREGPDGLVLTLWVLFAIWATDSWAYLAGRAIGGPKLMPVLSPKKTWAGLLGGIAGAIGIAALVIAIAGRDITWVFVVCTVAVSLAAQAGDLLESAIKRRFGAKDAGRIIPGHGGLLDRFDGHLSALVASALIVLAWPGAPLGGGL